MGLSCLPILLTITASHMFYCQSLSFTVTFTLPFTAHLGVYTCSFYFLIVSDICVCFYHVYVSVGLGELVMDLLHCILPALCDIILCTV